jgi:UDP-3-O-[3-hydroxymyristoyl] glucosamine N-acyltransferase
MTGFVRSFLEPLAAETLVARVGLPAVLRGNPMRSAGGIAPLGPGLPDALSFCDATDARDRVAASRSSIVVTVSSGGAQPRADQTLIEVDDPRAWFILAVAALLPGVGRPAAPGPGIHPGARVDPGAEVAPSAAIGDNVTIGPGSLVGPGAVVYADSTIGAGCCIGPNAVIGWVGLAYHRDHSGRRLFFPHLATVRIGDDVDVGANACICRGMLSDTVVGAHAKIGSLVYVSHGVVVDENAWISASAAIAGHSRLGEGALVGIGSVVVDNVAMAPDTLVGGGSVVTRDARAGEKLFGVPARHVPTIRRFGPTPR